MGMRAPRVPPDQLPPVSPRLMLRDLGALLDFGITFNAATNSIAVTTSTPYVPGR